MHITDLVNITENKLYNFENSLVVKPDQPILFYLAGGFMILTFISSCLPSILQCVLCKSINNIRIIAWKLLMCCCCLKKKGQLIQPTNAEIKTDIDNDKTQQLISA